MAKQEHVPETHETNVKPNREQRRHPDSAGQAEDQPIARDVKPEMLSEVQEARKKTSGHKKKTADKWNQ
jgi:hypothetical protein